MVKVVLLGAGNVAYHLTHNLLNNDTIKLIQVYNRSIEKLEYLKTITSITNNLANLKEADIYIICVSDDIIHEISTKINFENKLVVHTSGSVSIDELNSNSNKGVFYLLQTFSKDRDIDFSEIPICIEAKSENDLDLLKTLAKSISKKVYEIDSTQRKSLHLSAVFVNNFVNHLYFIGNEICDQNNIPFEILHPIIQETTNKLKSLSPFEAQTGPAKRNDKKTIDKHKAMLPLSQQEIYKLLTKSIQETYGKKL
jgi:predicted short-subunit dehydrogenase-like oxidoreductase (DUF2520 family)